MLDRQRLCLIIRDDTGIYEIDYRAFHDDSIYRVPLCILSQGIESIDDFFKVHDRIFDGIARVPFFFEGSEPNSSPEENDSLEDSYRKRRIIDVGCRVRIFGDECIVERLFEEAERLDRNILYVDFRPEVGEIEYLGPFFDENEYGSGSVKGRKYDLAEYWDLA